MKEERIEIRANEEFVEKVDYLKRINDYKSRADTIRKTVEKEYRKETDDCRYFPNCDLCPENPKCEEKAFDYLFGKEKEDGHTN